MRAARAGNGAAFAALYARHEWRLRAQCRRLLGDPLLAEEVAQQAVVEALVGLPSLIAPDRFGAWLLAIAAHLCRHRLRSPSLRLASFDALRDSNAMREPEAVDPEPARLIEAKESAQSLRLALAELPPAQRRAVELFYGRGLTLGETAAELRVSVGAVKARLHKARLSLRRLLADEPPGLEQPSDGTKGD